MALDPISNELKDFKKLEKVLISKRILEKIAIMHWKGEFSKIKETFAITCNILPRPAVSSELIGVKL